MSTYSSFSYPIESTNLDDITSALSQIPDNTAKLVSPKDVRDAVYTLWENVPFKFTATSDNLKKFVGYTGTGGNSEAKVPMYFGKRKFSNTDIMTSALIGTGTSDFFFFNNKADNVAQSTRLTILSGTSSVLHNSAPYIESKFISGASYSNLVIINSSTSDGSKYGNIEITAGTTNMGATGSTQSGGNVLINGLPYNKYYDPGELSGYHNQVLRYNHVKGRLELSEDNEVDSIISSGTASVIGNPVYIKSNGTEIPLLYSSPTDGGVPIPVPHGLGGINAGETFVDATYESMINRLLYAYESPVTDLDLVITPTNETNGTNEIIYEYGDITNISYTFDITKKSNPITTINPVNLSNFPTIATPLNSSFHQTTPLNIPTSVVTTDRRKEFNLSITDNTGFTVSNSVFLNKVYPFMWGTSTVASNDQSAINLMINNLVTTQVVGIRKTIINVFDEKNFDFVGNGVCIYYMYPKYFYSGGPLVPTLTSITFSGFEFINSFTKYELLLTSNSKWVDVPYVVWIYTPTPNTPSQTTVGDLNTNYRATYKIKH